MNNNLMDCYMAVEYDSFHDVRCRMLVEIIHRMKISFYVWEPNSIKNLLPASAIKMVFVGPENCAVDTSLAFVGYADSKREYDKTETCENVLIRFLDNKQVTSDNPKWMTEVGLPCFSSSTELKMKLELMGHSM